MGKAIPLRRATASISEDQGPDYKGDKTSLPYGFRYARDGSIERIIGHREDGGPNWGFLCSPIEFLATTENAQSKAPGLLVRIKTDNGRWHQLAFPRSALVGGDDLLRELTDYGLRFVPVGRDVTELKRLLVTVIADKRAR
jgi:Domain of unknown function (DUF927)